MKLIGSITSPYVRRVRLLLNTHGFDYEFQKIQALSPEGGKVLMSYGSIKRIPILILDDKKIFDSSIIAEYLLAIKGINLSIDDKLKLKLIDELADSGITLFQQKLWDIDADWTDERSKRVLDRFFLIMNELEDCLNELSELQQEWLFCVLDWVIYRSIFEFEEHHQNLKDFYINSQKLAKFKETRII